MELAVKAEIFDVTYRLAFREPLLHFLGGEQRLALLRNLLSLFELRLNDLRFNDQNISTDHIHFSKFYGSTFLNVSFGLEEVEANISRVRERNQVRDIFSKIYQVTSDSPLARQQIVMRWHFSSQEDVNSYLRGLIANIPARFEPSLQTTGASYTLRMEELSLTINVTVVGSLPVPGGLLLIIDNEFYPNKIDFEQALKISEENFGMIADALGVWDALQFLRFKRACQSCRLHFRQLARFRKYMSTISWPDPKIYQACRSTFSPINPSKRRTSHASLSRSSHLAGVPPVRGLVRSWHGVAIEAYRANPLAKTDKLCQIMQP